MADLQQCKGKCLQAEQLLQKARKYQNKHWVLQALALYQEVINEAPKPLVEPYLGLAYVAFSNGQKDDALALLQQALDIEPMNLRAQTLLQRMDASQPNSTHPTAPVPGRIKSLRGSTPSSKDLQNKVAIGEKSSPVSLIFPSQEPEM